ncbi:hypothetical protein BJ508DRAFT_303276 [Ascobolus immersus RN42]|uniref:CxC1-like cysteine cluster associated with KDZ transposases domain-containing protein n=1 Tax=Ascobolus immersus RN42 TaxID=1160509 RepID=A0A3N4IGX2_ASCIM|nr:hypothetical protein BJ508DRAFT_303276 [Ascobolus immersus RN42]
MVYPRNLSKLAINRVKRIERDRERKQNRERCARTTLYGGEVVWGKSRGKSKHVSKKDASVLQKTRVDLLAKEITFAKRSLSNYDKEARPNIDVSGGGTFEFDAGDDFGFDDNRFGEHIQIGLVNTVKRETDILIERRAKRRIIKQYAKEQMENVEIQERIIPALGRTWADNAMYGCGCLERDKTNIRLYFMDILTLACEYRVLQKCRCEHWSARLIVQGFFPTKARPGVAISIDLMELFLSFVTNGPFSKQGNAFAIRQFHRYKFRFEPLKRYDEIFRAAVPFYLRVRRWRDDSLNRAHNEFFKTFASLNMFQNRSEPTDLPQNSTSTVDKVGGNTTDITSAERNGSDTLMTDGAETEALTTTSSPHEGETQVGSVPKASSEVYPRITLGTLVSQCPACFYRKPGDDGPVICGLDGNMQHCRYAHVGKSIMNSLEYGLRYFFPVMSNEKERVNAISQVVAGTICEHNFKATAKPATMTFKDETGLLMIVCRHDMPLRFLNIYAGERLGWVVYTLEHFVNVLEKEVGKLDLILLYDIACQLSPYIKNRHPKFAERITVAVNKFHGYAHEFRCQELFGQHQTARIGQSDGEGTERVWALLRTLVASGRISTTPNRILYIETLSSAIMFRKRMNLGSSLWHRYKRNVSLLERLKRDFKDILEKEVKDGHGNKAVVTKEFLREQHLRQREYFTKTSPLVGKPNLVLFELLKEEMDLIAVHKRVQTQYEGRVLSEEEKDQYRAALFNAQIFRREEVTEKIEAELKKANQTREEWEPGSERWAMAAKASNQEQRVFSAIMHEQALLAKQAEKVAKDPPVDPAILAGIDRLVKNAIAVTDRQIAILHSDRSEWVKGKPLFDRQFQFQKLAELKSIYSTILQSAASRALALRRVKAHVFGGKSSSRLMSSIHKSHASMSKDIAKFNKLIEQVPGYEEYKLKLESFNGADDLTPGMESEKARDVLFHLHILNTDLLGTGDGPRTYWAASEDVRVGISLQLQIDRTEEELVLLKLEWERHVAYTFNLLRGLLLFVIRPPRQDALCVPETYRILWEEVQAGQNLLDASEQAKKKFGPDILPVGKLPALMSVLLKRLRSHYCHPDFLPRPVDNSVPQQPVMPEAPAEAEAAENAAADLDGMMEEIMADPLNELQDLYIFGGPKRDPSVTRQGEHVSNSTNRTNAVVEANQPVKVEERDVELMVFPEDEPEALRVEVDADVDSSDDEGNERTHTAFTQNIIALDEAAEFDKMVETSDKALDEVADLFFGLAVAPDDTVLQF